MRQHSNEPIILWIDQDVIDLIPEEFCANTVSALAEVSIPTAQHRLRNYMARGLIKQTLSDMSRKYYQFAPSATQQQRLNLFAMTHPDQVRQILSMLPDPFETKHIWPKLHASARHIKDAPSQCIVRMIRFGLVERVGLHGQNIGLYRKLPQQ